MVNWQLNMEVVQVVLGCRAAPSDVKGFTNVAMAWMPKSGHGADGRLANHHGAPFWHLRSLEVQRGGSFYLTMVGTVFCIVCTVLKAKTVADVRSFFVKSTLYH
jgi:hypothetical protein